MTGEVARRAFRLRIVRRFLRRVEIVLRIRRITPRDGELRPMFSVRVPELDTGGGYRPAWRQQDPAVDPREPYGGESSGTGNDHGWSNCSMTAGALALAYETGGTLALWGGDLRHHQGDLSGGTDLYDVRDAWKAYGETLTIKSGAGWGAVVAAHDDGRAIVIQGSGQVPGMGDFAGGHACAIGPEPKADGQWLFGDPLATGWQWIPPGDIKKWASAWQSSIAFAVSRVVTAAPIPPDPAPAPCPPCPDCPPPGWSDAEVRALVEGAGLAAQGELVNLWADWLRAPSSGPADHWDAGAWASLGNELAALLDEPDPCAPGAPAHWARGVPFPADYALAAVRSPGVWNAPAWLAATWSTG